MLSRKILAIFIVTAALFGCSRNESHQAPAEEHHDGEANVVHLDAEQQQKAGIKIAPVISRALQ
ncbi:MAG: hypothetical protein ACRENG_20985, partial [bacterium]